MLCCVVLFCNEVNGTEIVIERGPTVYECEKLCNKMSILYIDIKCHYNKLFFDDWPGKLSGQTSNNHFLS